MTRKPEVLMTWKPDHRLEPQPWYRMLAVRGGALLAGVLLLSALAGMTWVYPTLSEGVRKAAQSTYTQLLARRPVRAAVRLLMRLKGR